MHCQRMWPLFLLETNNFREKTTGKYILHYLYHFPELSRDFVFPQVVISELS